MKIYLASDHRGFELKNKIIKWLKNEGHEIFDQGNTKLDPDDDYPDFGKKLALEVSKDEEATGISFCGTGVGMSIAVNKFPKIRAVCCKDPNIVMLARADNNTNVICLGADWIEEEEAKDIITIWLKTPFSNEERHNRRLKKIENINS